jgi:hypothetical protein
LKDWDFKFPAQSLAQVDTVELLSGKAGTFGRCAEDDTQKGAGR